MLLGAIPRESVLKPQYFFLHIPKTAGTSFLEILESNFDRQDICPAYLYKDLKDMPRSELEGYRLIRGHFRYELLRHYLGSDPLLITMLREPMSRTISHLRFLKRTKQLNGPLKQFVPIDDLSLDEVARHPIIRNFLRNYQVKQLAYGFGPAMTTPEHLMFDHSINYEGLLEKAKQRLNDSFFVGLTERFDESKRLLLRQFGKSWADMPTPARNVAKITENDQFSPDVLESLPELLDLDFELYQHAKQLFDQRLVQA